MKKQGATLNIYALNTTRKVIQTDVLTQKSEKIPDGEKITMSWHGRDIIPTWSN